MEFKKNSIKTFSNAGIKTKKAAVRSTEGKIRSLSSNSGEPERDVANFFIEEGKELNRDRKDAQRSVTDTVKRGMRDKAENAIRTKNDTTIKKNPAGDTTIKVREPLGAADKMGAGAAEKASGAAAQSTMGATESAVSGTVTATEGAVTSTTTVAEGAVASTTAAAESTAAGTVAAAESTAAATTAVAEGTATGTAAAAGGAATGWWVLLIIAVVVLLAVLITLLINALTGYVDDGSTSAWEYVDWLGEEYYLNFQTQINSGIAECTNGSSDLPQVNYYLNGVLVELDAGEDGAEHFTARHTDEILAIWVVLSARDGTVEFSEESKPLIKEIFDKMNALTLEVENNKMTAPATEYVVDFYFTDNSLTVDELAAEYGFDDSEKERLAQLLSAEGEEYLRSISGIRSGVPIDGHINLTLPEDPTRGDYIVYWAKGYLGRSYSSMDCSALVRAAYEKANVPISGTSTTMAKYCVDHDCLISRGQLQPGDLIFWRSVDPDRGAPFCANSNCGGSTCRRWGMIHHVAIYIGDGQVIESATGGVQIRAIWETDKWQIAYYARPYIRILEERGN